MKYGLEESIIEQILNIINKYNKYNFKLFGSRARGDYSEKSDIDIAIFENVEKNKEYEIRNDFDELDIIYKIDLVFVTDKTKQELLDSIKRDGVDFNEKI